MTGPLPLLLLLHLMVPAPLHFLLLLLQAPFQASQSPLELLPLLSVTQPGQIAPLHSHPLLPPSLLLLPLPPLLAVLTLRL
jgi:hypothetical protein